MKKAYVLATAVAISLVATNSWAETSTMPASSATEKMMSSVPAKSSNQAHSHNSCKCCNSQQDK